MKIRGNLALDPSSYRYDGGKVGCLAIHGFTGTPLEMKPLAEFLHSRGLTTAAPLLAGHGTTPEDLNSKTWQDWLSYAEQALGELRARCETVFVAGLSMGALVALHLACRHPDLAGLLLYSPALRVANRCLFLTPLAKFVIKQFPKEPEDGDDLIDPGARDLLWHYDTQPVAGAAELFRLQRVVKSEMGRVRVPAIVFYSTLDSAIHPSSGPQTYLKLGSEDKELVVLHNSGHCMLVDGEREAILARSWEFIAARSVLND